LCQIRQQGTHADRRSPPVGHMRQELHVQHQTFAPPEHHSASRSRLKKTHTDTGIYLVSHVSASPQQFSLCIHPHIHPHPTGPQAGRKQCLCTLVVLRVRSRRVELHPAPNHLLHRAQEVLLTRDLFPCPDGEHTRFRSHSAQFCARRVGTQS